MEEYTASNPLRCFFAFEGYNAQGLALRRLSEHYPDFSFVCVGRSEIDKYAIQACKALFPEEAEKNYGDVTKIDWSAVPDFDLITWSSPCTSISNAGKREGLIEGSGTESSLLWELRKVLDCKKPKYIILENVKAFVGKKNIKEVGRFFDMLRGYGYSVYWSIMNAKDYGVPQNRERVFVVAMLGDEAYSFPKPFELERRLSDVLEQNVDERYYLTDKTIKGFMSHNINHKTKDTGFIWKPKTGNDIANCLRSNGRLCPTDNTIYSTEPISCAMRGRNPHNPSDRTAGIKTEQCVEIETHVPNCITTVQKDSLVAEPKIIQIANISEEKGFRNPQTGRVYSSEGISPTLNTMQGGGREPKIVEQCRIRKLTVREVFRLMDVEDKDIDKIMNAGISNTQCYKMAGNSIVVSCLYYIFKNLFVEKSDGNVQLTLF